MINSQVCEIKNITVDGAGTSHKENYKGKNYLPFGLLPRPAILNLIKYILPACFFLALALNPALARIYYFEQEQEQD